MSCLRSYVKVQQKRERAKENGNAGAVFLLFVVGALFLASHAMYAQIGRVRGSLKNFFQSIKSRETLQNAQQVLSQNLKNASRNAANELSKDAVQQTVEGIGNAVNIDESRERD